MIPLLSLSPLPSLIRYSVDYSTAPLTNDSTSKDRKLLSASSVLSWIPEAKEDHNNKIRCLATNAFLQRANLPPLIENKVISVKCKLMEIRYKVFNE